MQKRISSPFDLYQAATLLTFKIGFLIEVQNILGTVEMAIKVISLTLDGKMVVEKGTYVNVHMWRQKM